MDAPEARLTRGEVFADMQSIYDGTHDLSKRFFRQEQFALDYVDALYKAAYGDAKVDLSDGIEIPKR